MKLGLGSWRLLLAFFVAISHLYKDMIHGPAAYAVWGFFLLSGYLMTFVLTEKYGLTKQGMRNYAINRFLRIYPPYAIACVLGAVTLAVLPKIGFDPVSLNPQFRFPAGSQEWLANVFMIALLPQSGLLVPVAGALFVEIAAYALMPLFATSRAAAVLGVILAFLMNFQLGFDTQTFAPRYAGIATCMLPFAVGALICHYRHALRPISSPVYSVGAWLLFCLIWLPFPSFPWTYGLMISIILSAWVVISLAEIKTGWLDKWAGDLSYPIYLLHTTAGAWWMVRMGDGRSFKFFLAAFGTTVLLSILFVLVIDKPLQKKKVKPKAMVQDNPPAVLASVA